MVFGRIAGRLLLLLRRLVTCGHRIVFRFHGGLYLPDDLDGLLEDCPHLIIVEMHRHPPGPNDIHGFGRLFQSIGLPEHLPAFLDRDIGPDEEAKFFTLRQHVNVTFGLAQFGNDV